MTARYSNVFVRIACLIALLAMTGTSLAQNEAPAEATPHKKIYFFEHQLIPEWVHKTDGAFFNDLISGNKRQLADFASKAVSPEFSAGISIIAYPDKGSLLITFPQQKEPPECYFIYIRKNAGDQTFSLYTYEKTLKLPDTDFKGVVGSWTADKAHSSRGPRSYDDVTSFISEIEQ